MSILVLKWIHILSATLLMGGGVAIAFFQWSAYRRYGGAPGAAAIAAVTHLVVRADALFTAPAALVQLASGLTLVCLLGVPWASGWVQWALLLYALVGACWLPVVMIQIRLARLAACAAQDGSALPPAFHRGMRLWFLLGWPAFTAMLGLFWLMVRKPTLPPLL